MMFKSFLVVSTFTFNNKFVAKKKIHFGDSKIICKLFF